MATPPPGIAGLPSANPTKSYWLHDPSKVLLGHRTTEKLPEEADIVIVGSGITGSFAARFLFEEEEKMGKSEEEKSRVVMLEAREAVSGATGRNGGHCQPLVYGAVPEVAEFEIENFEYLKKLVEEENIDCDWTTLPAGVHAFYTPNLLSLARSSLHSLQKSHPALGSTLELITSPVLFEKYRVPTALGVILQKKAASLWPYKLVAHILTSLLSSKKSAFNLQTNTPVTSLTPSSTSGGGGWTLTTPRGNITTKKLLIATNGYTSNLLPSFSDLIVPVRGQVSALIPPVTSVPLSHSYLFAADPEEEEATAITAAPRDDYLSQRPPHAKNEIIYGGGRRFASCLGVGISSDDQIEEKVASYLRKSLTPVLDLSSEGEELKASHEWSGIMGYSRDLHAWVGEVPRSLFPKGGDAGGGVYVCAGYTGHGMPAATLSARAVAKEMLGVVAKEEKGGKVKLPKEFKITEERVQRARGLPLVQGGWEVNTLGTLFSGVLGEEKSEE
ncbi:FAD dependent oxidoreductase-domain-containing protein [Podospora fimiseda]|uniref:FAD dependent oxidoreductase-domain-containing protein n=1 Tax=Podospora fimiseda TaxID=252190 RepID=A0AAN7BV94_9PEZI|nr:FAD dependent oxidoreductase-domain-containing protein [Podospora fimiseda]